MGADAPRQRKDRRLPIRGQAEPPKAITAHFTAPSFGQILSWPGYNRTFASSPLTLLVFQYVCNALDGRRRVEMPARQVCAELRCSIRTIRRAYKALRSQGLILTTITDAIGGGDYWLRFMPGPELCRLTGFDPRKRAAPPVALANAPDIGSKSVIHNKKEPLTDPRFSRVYRGDMVSSPNPITDYNRQHRSTPPPVENLRQRGNSAHGGGFVLIGPKGRMVERLNGALRERGRELGAIDLRACHAVARMAVELHLENEAEAIARYAGRATWARVPGAVMVQRFVDLLERMDLGERIPAQWQHRRRSERERIKHRIDGGPK